MSCDNMEQGKEILMNSFGEEKPKGMSKTVLKIITDRQKDKILAEEVKIKGIAVEHNEVVTDRKKKRKKKNKRQLDSEAFPEENMTEEESPFQPKKKKKKGNNCVENADNNNAENGHVENDKIHSSESEVAKENVTVPETQLTPEVLKKKSKKKNKNVKKIKKENTVEGEELKSSEKPKRKPKRFVLFLGNLPYEITKEEVEEHFKVVRSNIVRISLLTNPDTGEGKGYGFMELSAAKAYHDALKLNLSKLQDRKIKVEFTVPGKKVSKTRKTYIKMKTKKILGQKRIKKKRGKRHGHKRAKEGVKRN